MKTLDSRWQCITLLMMGSLVATVPAAVGEASDWPQWRGPSRDGTAAGDAWPDSLGPDRLKLAWRVELGPSYSGPIVVGGRVFTTETQGEKTEVISAYDCQTGKQLWATDWPGAMRVPFFAAANGSWIRSTPACDGELLFVGGIRDVLVALEVATGDERWSVDFVQEFGTPLPAFGCASSPVVDREAVYMQAGGGFVKLDKRTGKVLWRTSPDGGGMSGGAFSSPLLATLSGKPMAVVQTRQALKGIELSSGKETWSQPIEAFRGMNILTPVLHNDALFTSAHSGRSQLWRIANAGSPGGSGGGLEEVWSNKSQAYMSSPVVIGDHMYLHLRNRRIQCVDLKSGEETWRTKPYGKYQSMAVLGDRILALDQRGELLLFRADPTRFDLIDTRKVSEQETWAHIAVCGGQVFVRELGALAVYDWR